MPFQGKIKTRWGIPGHEECIKRGEVNVMSLRNELNVEHLLKVIPFNHRSRYDKEYFTVWCCSHLGTVVPFNWTLRWYRVTFQTEIALYQAKLKIEAERIRIEKEAIRKKRAKQRSIEIATKNSQWRLGIEEVCRENDFPYKTYYSFIHKVPFQVRYRIKSMTSEEAAVLGHLAILTKVHGSIHTVAVNGFYFDEIVSRYNLIALFANTINSTEWFKLYIRFGKAARVREYIDSLEVLKNDPNTNFLINVPKENNNVCQFEGCNHTKSDSCDQNRCGSHCCSSTCTKHRASIESIFIRKFVLGQLVTIN
jgi:hypothetical protein